MNLKNISIRSRFSLLLTFSVLFWLFAGFIVIRRTKPTGEQVWLMSTFTPVKDEYGNVFKVFFLGKDITERKLKYQLLEEANKEIDRLRKELD